MPVRVLLDDNIRADTLAYLRGIGIDATSVREAGLSGASDDDVTAWATAEDRLVITFNHHFGDIRSALCAGVIRLRIEPQTAEAVHPVLRALFATVPSHRLRGALTTVTRDKVRVRPIR